MNRPAGCFLAESSVIRIPDDDHATRNQTGSRKQILLKRRQKSVSTTEGKF